MYKRQASQRGPLKTFLQEFRLSCLVNPFQGSIAISRHSPLLYNTVIYHCYIVTSASSLVKMEKEQIQNYLGKLTVALRPGAQKRHGSCV